MDADRTRSAGQKAKGSVKEAIGKITGNKSTEAEGAAQKAGGIPRVGKIREPAGDADKR